MTAIDRPVYVLLGLVALLAAPVGLLAPHGLAPLFAVTGGLAALLWWRRAPWRGPALPVLAFAAAIAVLGLAGTLWAPDPGQTARTSVRLLAMSVCGASLVGAMTAPDPAVRRRLGLLLVAGIGLTFALLAVEYLAGRAVSRLVFGTAAGIKSHFARGATMAALLLWPAVLVMRARFGSRMAMAAVAATVLVVMVGDSGSTRMALAAALAAAGAVARWPQARVAVQAVALVLVVALPIGARMLPSPQETFQWAWLPNSLHHRLTIWNFTAQRAWEKPVLGWGFDAARDIPGADEEVPVRRWASDGTMLAGVTEPLLPLHPHNAILQWWLELGLVGTAVMAAFVVWLLGRAASSPDAWTRAARTGAMVTALGISTISYGFWQAWWQGGLWLAAALLALSREET
jgi:O-antigen ligase